MKQPLLLLLGLLAPQACSAAILRSQVASSRKLRLRTSQPEPTLTAEAEPGAGAADRVKEQKVRFSRAARIKGDVREVEHEVHVDVKISAVAAPPSLPVVTKVARAPAEVGKPVVNFLFMSYEAMPHKDAWERFFAGGTPGVDFRVFVHCKYNTSCAEDLWGHPLFHLIETVETQYCFGLVEAMNSLLRAALAAGQGNRNDKFTFVSDTTVPVKPFRYVYRQLTSNTDSNFCFFPQHWMAWPNSTSSLNWLLPHFFAQPPDQNVTQSTQRFGLKHHQWMTLSRAHALQAVEKDGMFPSLLKELRVNSGWPGTISGCDDEFWHFNTLFGGVNVTTNDLSSAAVHLLGVAKGDVKYEAHELQGQCDTFVYWQGQEDGLTGGMQLLGKRLEVDEFTHISHRVGHPCQITSLGTSSLRALRRSPFLFARKVMPSCTVDGMHHGREISNLSIADALDTVIYSQPSPQIQQLVATEAAPIEPKHDTRGALAEDAANLHLEIAGDISLFVSEPAKFVDSPAIQTAVAKMIATIVGVRDWDVQVDIKNVGGESALADYLQLSKKNVIVRFKIKTYGDDIEDRLTKAREVDKLLRTADLAAVSSELQKAMLAQDHFDDTAQAVRVDLQSLAPGDERPSLIDRAANLPCAGFGVLCGPAKNESQQVAETSADSM